jgi:MFS family permease
LRRLTIDLTPLRASRDFRLVWLGLLITSVGSQFTLIAVLVQVKELTESEAAVGATGLAWLVGLVTGSLAGGAILDVWDRRRLLMSAQIGLATGSSILLAGALAGEPPLWLIYAGLAVLAAGSALDGPTRSAMTPRLVGPALVPAAQALNQVVWNTAGLLGPAVAGVVVARAGVTVAYAVDLASIACMFVAAALLHPMPPLDTEHAETGLRAIREGFAFARRHRLIMSTFVIDLIRSAPSALPLPDRGAVPSVAGGARAPVRGSGRGRPLRRAHERVDGTHPTAGGRGDRVRSGVGMCDRRVRMVGEVAVVRPRDARGGGVRRRD